VRGFPRTLASAPQAGRVTAEAEGTRRLSWIAANSIGHQTSSGAHIPIHPRTSEGISRGRSTLIRA
jgi:hypothetical protein